MQGRLLGLGEGGHGGHSSAKLLLFWGLGFGELGTFDGRSVRSRPYLKIRKVTALCCGQYRLAAWQDFFKV